MIDEWSTCLFRGRYFEMFAIISKEKIVGYVSLYEHSKTVASIGPFVIAQERCKGVATEAVSLLLQQQRAIGSYSIKYTKTTQRAFVCTKSLDLKATDTFIGINEIKRLCYI